MHKKSVPYKSADIRIMYFEAQDIITTSREIAGGNDPIVDDPAIDAGSKAPPSNLFDDGMSLDCDPCGWI